MDNSAKPTAYSYIRFSTPEQMHGDSLRRQTESSTSYAEEHCLELDTTLNLRDLGVSAFKGENVEKGRLGAFIKAIDEGLVEKGSFLLVESLDRLSRAEVMDALEVFLIIVNKGITIVSLLDGRKYSRESIRDNATELIVSIVVMSRAYDESVTKSKRRRKTWNQQKRLAATSATKMTKKLPFWLSLPDSDGEFVVNEEMAAVVHRVFELSKAGLGFSKIAQALNADGVPSPAARNYSKAQKYEGNPRTWANSSIGYLLRNEAVIGNLVMAEAIPEKDEQPVPHRIDGYYPRIIDDELFYAIQGRRQPPRGKSSALKLNLFTGLLYCGYCKGPAQVDTNTKATHRRSRICCQRKRRGLECMCKTWSYEEFEEDFFAFVHEVDIGTLVERKTEDATLADEISELKGRLSQNEGRLARLRVALEDDQNVAPATVMNAIRERESERAQLESQLRVAEVRFEAEHSFSRRAENEIRAFRNQFSTLKSLPPDERLVIRYSIAERVASVVKSIWLYPNGNTLRLIDLDTDLPRPADLEPYFVIEFHNGSTGWVRPGVETSYRINLSKKN